MRRTKTKRKTRSRRSSLHVEVIYALPHRHVLIETVCDPEATLADVVRASGILDRFPEIDLARNPLGVFGARTTPSARVADGDRIEIYRPLHVDPKAARRLRHARTIRGKR